MSCRLRFKIIAPAVAVIVALSLVQGCAINILRNPARTTSPAAATGDVNYDLLKEAYGVIQDNYVVPGTVDANKETQGAIRGMVQALDDPYSAYLSPDQFKLTQSDFAGTFQGIGAFVGLDANKVVSVIAPIPGTPADKAGIKSGDEILEVDGKSTENMTVQDVVLLIRGPKGTSVTLKILHKDATQTVTLEITRADIQATSALLEMKGDYAHITITQFTELTDKELAPLMDQVAQNKAKGIILDLRHNPGGILSTVVQIASRFIDQGDIVSVVDRNGNKQTQTANRFASKTSIPMVVLVDEFSASGSEVLSGALQDYKRATVAGQKTFGKGSVDQLMPLSDGGGIYITVARWVTPNGHLIEGEGIQPDIVVDWTKVDGVQWGIDYLSGLNK